MRIVYTLNDQRKGRQLSAFLASEGIENQLEIQTVTDWGNPNYGDVLCKLWIYDEDQVANANRWIKKFEETPSDPLFKQPAAISPYTVPAESIQTAPNKTLIPPINGAKLKNQPSGILTLGLLGLCSLLYFYIASISPSIPSSYPSYLPPLALFSPPLKKAMLFDYPKSYEIADKLVNLYGLEKLQTPQNLSLEGKALLKQFYSTPKWEGLYPIFLNSFQNKHFEFKNSAPLFEKIDQGQVWRFFTPCLLHSDILHLLFNMIWLALLGKQLEERLGRVKFLLLILLTGVFSNTCQYLMSGANFIGISGVLCAMLTFIWMRQKLAPWEGYPLQKSTINFMILFITAMLSIQLLSFYLEIQEQASTPLAIANTAHWAGAISGAILGRFSFFSWKI
jgi:GlpG protein